MSCPFASGKAVPFSRCPVMSGQRSLQFGGQQEGPPYQEPTVPQVNVPNRELTVEEVNQRIFREKERMEQMEELYKKRMGPFLERNCQAKAQLACLLENNREVPLIRRVGDQYINIVDEKGSPSINAKFKVFNEANDLIKETADVQYGVLKLLEGTWASYIPMTEGRIVENPDAPQGAGLHTTCMPSPGTTSHQIPGKYRFLCQEYLEVLKFDLVPGGIRNRGGAAEQFCGAVKYEQKVKEVPTKATPGQTNVDAMKEFHMESYQDAITKYTDIHVENGMYLWLNKVLCHPATEDSIKKDRGIYPIFDGHDEHRRYPDETTFVYQKKDTEILEDLTPAQYQEKLNQGEEWIFVAVKPPKELKPGAGLNGPFYVPDYSISRTGVIPHGSAVTATGKASYGEGKPLFGLIRPNPIKKKQDDKAKDDKSGAKEEGKPGKESKAGEKSKEGSECKECDKCECKTGGENEGEAINPYEGAASLTIHPTMGGRGLQNFFLDKLYDKKTGKWLKPIWINDLHHSTDPNENRIYIKPILQHPLFPYSTRPNLFLRDATFEQKILNFVEIELNTQDAGREHQALGGIVNIPFVRQFVDTTTMKFKMWIETVWENGKFIPQLQYEQIVTFEFGFGDSGGKTVWPHIQVGTLRRIEDLPPNYPTRIWAEKEFKLENTANDQSGAAAAPQPTSQAAPLSQAADKQSNATNDTPKKPNQSNQQQHQQQNGKKKGKGGK